MNTVIAETNIFKNNEVSTYTEYALKLLREMIETPSISGQESLLSEKFLKLGNSEKVKTKKIENNIIFHGSNQSEKRKDLIFLSHIDTVSPAEGWKNDPYTAVLSDEKLYGLGSNDAGASVVTYFSLFKKLNELDKTYSLPFNLKFIAAAEEETSGKNGVSLCLDEFKNAELVFVGEPTSMMVATAEKGLVVFDCTAKGETAHVAHNKGINAISLAVEDIKWINSFKDPKPSNNLGSLKLTVSQINGGIKHNQLPSSCSFVVDARVTDTWSNEELLSTLKKGLHSSVEARSLRLNSSSLPQSHCFWNVIESCDLQTYGSPTMSDQAILKDIPSVKCGPGDSIRSHTANEFIKTDEIRDGIELFGKILNNYIQIKNSSKAYN